MIRKLSIFDFDGTLVHSHHPDEGKRIWFEKTGNKWPYIGWWGKEESLNDDIFDIERNDWVYKHYLDAKSDDSTVVLITGRMEKSPNMRNRIDYILKKHNMSFDDIYLSDGVDTLRFKLKLFDRLIDYGGFNVVDIYDDRSEHLSEFRKWAIGRKDINITIYDAISKEKWNNINK